MQYLLRQELCGHLEATFAWRLPGVDRAQPPDAEPRTDTASADAPVFRALPGWGAGLGASGGGGGDGRAFSLHAAVPGSGLVALRGLRQLWARGTLSKGTGAEPSSVPSVLGLALFRNSAARPVFGVPHRGFRLGLDAGRDVRDESEDRAMTPNHHRRFTQTRLLTL